MALAMVLLGSNGCGGPGDDGAEPGSTALQQQDIKPDGGTTYVAVVQASGTGCPAGTWTPVMARDDLLFTVTFRAYVAQLASTASTAAQDCTLTIRLQSPTDRLFSVQTIAYAGYALLEPTVVGRQVASYAFQGAAAQTEAGSADLTGPRDGDFSFRREIARDKAVWSSCGRQQALTIRTRISLDNTAKPGRTGYMSLSTTDGSALTVKLAASSCDGIGTTQPGSPKDDPPATTSFTMGEPKILDIDDWDNGNLLLAQSTQLAQPGTLTSLSFYVTEAKGLLRLGLYDASGPNGGPGNKLAETAEMTPVVGWNTAKVASKRLTAGTYWLAYLPSDGGLHFRRGGARSGYNTWYEYPYGPLPATFSTKPIESTDHWSLYGTLTP